MVWNWDGGWPPPPVTTASFIAAFPEFSASSSQASDFWISQAYLQLNARRFRESLPLAVMLFTAHYVAIGLKNVATANFGGVPGEASGPIASKGVGTASISYGTSDTAIEGAGQWNYTTYGQRLYSMMRAFTGGPSYVPGRRRVFDPYYR